MDIIRESDEKLTVTLEYSELLELGYTFHSLNYSSPDSRRTIKQLLEKAAAQTGFTYKNTSLMIEAYPGKDMGCTLVFTRLSTSAGKKFRRVNAQPTVFEFAAADDMMSAMLLLNQSEKYRCRLYLFGSAYRAVIPERLDIVDELQLTEFGKIIAKSTVAAAHTAEHGELLCSDGATLIGGIINQSQTDLS